MPTAEAGHSETQNDLLDSRSIVYHSFTLTMYVWERFLCALPLSPYAKAAFPSNGWLPHGGGGERERVKET